VVVNLESSTTLIEWRKVSSRSSVKTLTWTFNKPNNTRFSEKCHQIKLL
jgi:hypothetical protein